MVTFTCQELDLVRRGHSFASHRTEAGSSSSGQSVSVSNSVSHVRVEVGDPVLGFLSFGFTFGSKNSENRRRQLELIFADHVFRNFLSLCKNTLPVSHSLIWRDWRDFSAAAWLGGALVVLWRLLLYYSGKCSAA